MPRWLREPLLHFLLIGALLFLLFHWWGPGTASNRIVLTSGQIDSMVAGFTRTWQRPPTEEEIKGLVDDYVREEIAAREATAMGLERDDTIIRRRLRQKFEFLAEDTIDAAPPTEAELKAWFEQHIQKFRTQPEIAFRQVYVSPDRRGAAAESDARRILARLTSGGPDIGLAGIGDSLMLPHESDRSTNSEVARQFGEEFAETIMKIEPGRWAGPIRSGYGLHLVFVRERKDSRSPAFADVRAVVEREFLSERRKRVLKDMYDRLLERYRVTVAPRALKAGNASGASK